MTPPLSTPIPAALRQTTVGWLLVLAATVTFSLVTPIGKAVIGNGAPPLLVLSLRF